MKTWNSGCSGRSSKAYLPDTSQKRCRFSHLDSRASHHTISLQIVTSVVLNVILFSTVSNAEIISHCVLVML
jgi:hypothetical protein